MSTAEFIRPGDLPEDEQEIDLSSSSLSAIEEADRSHMIRTAKANPRSITAFIEELTAIACHSQETAMEMMYSIPRDGKQLIGPSIGFAEAALAVWGNARAGSEVVETNPIDGYVVAEGRYYDCEKNVGRAIRKRRRVVARKVTPDAIQVTGDAACSIATREAILRSIPKPLWKPVWMKARLTAAGDVKSVEQVRNGLIDSFHKMGVTDIQLFNALNVKGPADLGPDEIIAMNSWKNQLQEGSAILEDIFGSTDDAEIESGMKTLGWNEGKKTMAFNQYKGNRGELLKYVREQLKERGDTTPTTTTPATDKKEEAAPTETKKAELETKSAEPETKSTPAETKPATESPKSTAAKTTKKGLW